MTAARHSARTAALRALVFGALAPLALCACGGIELYSVVRTPVADCEIRPNGEFCGDVGPPVEQVFAIERKEEVTVLHFDELSWVARGITGERQVLKETRVTRDPGPCTSTLRQELIFDENGDVLQGTLEVSTRIEGPDACGETPRGERTLFSLEGARTDSI